MNEDEMNYAYDVGLLTQPSHTVNITLQGCETGEYTVEDYVDFVNMMFDAYQKMGFYSNLSVVSHNNDMFCNRVLTFDPTDGSVSSDGSHSHNL